MEGGIVLVKALAIRIRNSKQNRTDIQTNKISEIKRVYRTYSYTPSSTRSPSSAGIACIN
jgi:hypothetical protein